jgi:8-oxo-dGTP pyrophosphatase MutT (NUDIX family)
LPDKTPPIEAVRPKTVPARHAASLIVLRRRAGCEPEMLMGMRGAGHKFSPNRLVFPGGAVDRADLRAQALTPLEPATRRHLEKAANPLLAHGTGVAAARELLEETGLSLGEPPALDGLAYLCRMVTPSPRPIRFNARFLVIEAERASGRIGGDGELEQLGFVVIAEALAFDLAPPTRRVIDYLLTWLALSPDERAARDTTPAYYMRKWRQE